MNDTDAAFCTECGRPLGNQQPNAVYNQRRAYFIALLFLPIIVIAAAIGYYKFYLPKGIAAEVNGEEIILSELEAAVSRMQHMSEAAVADLRHQALNELIAERLMLQEARKAGITVSKDEIATAAAEARIASGLDNTAFRQAMKSLYGTADVYEEDLERHLMINRLLSQKVVPHGTDPQTAGRMVRQWLQGLSEKATVRVALTEQMSGPGCGCCNTSGGQLQSMRGAAGSGRAIAAGRQAAAGPTKAAADVGLKY